MTNATDATDAARPRAAMGGWDDSYQLLTSRERQIVGGLLDGASDRQIASGLGLSTRTVHKHLEHVYRKLGVASRTAAALRVVGRLGQRSS